MSQEEYFDSFEECEKVVRDILKIFQAAQLYSQNENQVTINKRNRTLIEANFLRKSRDEVKEEFLSIQEKYDACLEKSQGIGELSFDEILTFLNELFDLCYKSVNMVFQEHKRIDFRSLLMKKSMKIFKITSKVSDEYKRLYHGEITK